MEVDHGRPREPKKLRLWLKRHLSFFVEATCKDEASMPRQLTNKKLEEHRRSRDHWRTCAEEKQRFQEKKEEAWDL